MPLAEKHVCYVFYAGLWYKQGTDTHTSYIGGNCYVEYIEHRMSGVIYTRCIINASCMNVEVLMVKQ